MNNLAQKLFIGLAGTGAVEITNHIPVPNSTETKDIISAIVQVLIGIATIVGIFKKKKT
jgi:hypothetical protein